ncbi:MULTISPECIES: YpmS family protein [Rossellomorea]|uniref:YpmS family protein n=1 Tax=Rossellomorea TaxID=2837508 RepID=UPI001CC94BA1|nr:MULTISPECIES: YpmS family protein [Rossellomorea]MCA0147911.1 YpmS family protein [Rossellomorea vietnamensis]UTE76059.1 YpmS family protein [Rossellomorea sp. KS-H15a]WGG43894.1 YpmS family protein [Rossellomorea sp. DA94]
MKNKWKVGFFVLLGMIILGFVIIVSMIFMPVKDDALPDNNNNTDQQVGFNVETNKKDLNLIIEHYIEEEGMKGPVDYDVQLKDDVELLGSVPVFTSDLDFKLSFEPKALDNGDILLKQKSISVGSLNLPVNYVLKVIRDSYNFPDWVKIQPNDELIYVSLQDMKLKSDVKVRANKFDLKEDNISFRLLVPVDRAQ